MAKAHHSFAIIGAGPAGTACVNALLLGGATSVALIDRARFPRDKICGDGIGPGVITILDALGLQDILCGHDRVAQVSVAGSLGGRMKLDATQLHRRSPLGYVIPRLHFDHALLDAALRRGATDLTGWSLNTAAFSGRRWHLTLAHSESDETRKITADVLIGADGALSRVRRTLGQPLNAEARTSIAIRVYAKADTSAYQRFDFVEAVPSPGYGWVFSTGEGVVNIGVGAGLVAYKTQDRHLDQILEAYRAYLAEPFAYDETTCHSSVLPLASSMPRLAFPALRAALIGDAASMINPLTGEGIFYGMEAGRQLGSALAAAAHGSGNFPRALAGYERQFRRTFAAHFRGNWYLRKALERPPLLERMLNACAKNSDLCCDYIEYLMGNEHGVGTKPLYRLALETVFA